MSTLVAIAYPDAATAEQVRGELVQLTKEHLLSLEDAVVVEHRPDGKIKLHQAMSPAGAGAAGGALWGGLIGLIFLAPLLGMAIGAASGAVAGKVTDVGVNDDFLKQLGEKVPAGTRISVLRARSTAFCRQGAGTPDRKENPSGPAKGYHSFSAPPEGSYWTSSPAALWRTQAGCSA